MLDFVMGIGFAFVIEGLIWGLFPHQISKVLLHMQQMNEQTLRICGVGSLALGVGIIWFVQQARM